MKPLLRCLLGFTLVTGSVFAQTPTPGDRDGDLVVDEDDRCPDQVGLGRNLGCPEADVWESSLAGELEKREQEKAAERERSIYGPEPVEGWQEKVDAARERFYESFDAATTDQERADAVKRFGGVVRYDLSVQRGNGLDYAIEPVMRTRTRGNPDRGKLIAEAWKSATGGLYTGSVKMMAPEDAAAVQAEEAEASSRRKAEARAETDRQAKRQQVYKESKKAEERRRMEDPVFRKQKECEALVKAITWRGMSIGRGATYGGRSGIWKGLDCDTGMVLFEVPGSNQNWGLQTMKIPAPEFAHGGQSSFLAHEPCRECGGAGAIAYTEESTYSHSLPQGHFSGIEVRKTYTRSERKGRRCEGCQGTGVE